MKKTNNKEKHENKSFADIIRELRVQNKLTQKELADKIGVSDRTISKWEKGSSVPDLVCLTNICKELGVSPSLMINYKYSFKDRLNKAKLSLRKLLKFLTNNIFVVFFFIIFILLFVYFINNYNAVKIYDLKYESDNIKIDKGYLFKTKAANILIIDNIKLCKIDYEPKTIKVELYTYHYGDKYIIYESNSLNDIFIEKNNSNIDLLNKDVMKDLKDSIYLEITTIDNNDKENIYKATITMNKKFENNKLIYKRNNEIAKIENSNYNNKEQINKELINLGYEYNKNDNVYTRIDEYGGKIEFRPSTAMIKYTKNNKSINFNIIIYKKTNRVEINVYNITNVKKDFLLCSLDNKKIKCINENHQKYTKEIDCFLSYYEEIINTL